MISRAGTGSLGTSSSPISITFSFAPTVVIPMEIAVTSSNCSGYIDLNRSNETPILKANSLSTSFAVNSGWKSGNSPYYGKYIKKSSDGKTIYWYASNAEAGTASYMFNSSSYTYYFLGIA